MQYFPFCCDVSKCYKFFTIFFFLKYFEKYGRENFGVQQLPLFNLLKPEDVDWLSAFRNLKVEDD